MGDVLSVMDVQIEKKNAVSSQIRRTCVLQREKETSRQLEDRPYNNQAGSDTSCCLRPPKNSVTLFFVGSNLSLSRFPRCLREYPYWLSWTLSLRCPWRNRRETLDVLRPNETLAPRSLPSAFSSRRRAFKSAATRGSVNQRISSREKSPSHLFQFVAHRFVRPPSRIRIHLLSWWWFLGDSLSLSFFNSFYCWFFVVCWKLFFFLFGKRLLNSSYLW